MRHALVLLVLFFHSAAVSADDAPRPVDERLKIELFAEAPDIVTPIDLDVDERGRVFVIESHTHFRPENYRGPATDRIRYYEDLDGDRKADRITTFHEADTHTMGLRWHPSGWLYVATRREVFRIRDTDDDGKADERQSLVKLDTPGDYPHNGLCGFAFDFRGDVFFGFGENLGAAYKLIGSDGATLTGGGEGGNIYRCKPDGSKLAHVATGFWNPFGMDIDAFGRLFAVDNDPDSRPPCRLLHIVEGGDYGFRFRNGRKGLHPFTSWNGEIPGTLPMVAGTGEAPSEVLAYESDNLPADYLGTLLVTSWGDHRLERFVLKPHGASFTSKAEPIIQGGENFRPVGLALAPDGSLYMSDWVSKSYPLHGQGRIWRVSAKEEKKVERPDAEKEPEEALRSKHRPLREAAARAIDDVQRLAALAAKSEDPRTAAAALFELARRGELTHARIETVLESRLDAVADAAAWLITDPAFADKVLYSLDGFSGNLAGPPKIIRPYKDPDRTELDGSDTFILLALIRHRNPDGGDFFEVLMMSVRDPFIWHAAKQRVKSSFEAERLKEVTLIAPGDLAEPTGDTAAFADLRLINVGVVLAQRETAPLAYDERLSAYLETPDPLVRFAAIQWIAEEKLEGHRDRLLKSLARPDNTPRLVAAYLAALELVDGATPQAADRDGPSFYLLKLLNDEKAAAGTRAMALRMMPADHEALSVEQLKALAGAADEGLALEAVRTLRLSGRDEAQAALLVIAKDDKWAAALRAEAVAGLSGESQEQRDLLFDLATGLDGALRREALRTLRGVKLSAERTQILSRFAQAHPEEAEAIERAIADPAQAHGPRERPAPGDTKVWLQLLEQQGDDGATPQAAEGAKRRALAGERVFFHAKAGACFRCHTVRGRGGNVGPDLSVVGSAMSRERLIESILQPSNEIAPRYAAYLVETTDGETRTLMHIGPRPDGLEDWGDAEGNTIALSPADIVEKRPLKSSIMPDDLHKAMTVRELADLIAFLQSLK